MLSASSIGCMQYPTVDTRAYPPNDRPIALRVQIALAKKTEHRGVLEEVASAILATSRVDAATAIIYMCCGKADHEFGITQQLINTDQVANVVLFDKVSPAEKVRQWTDAFPEVMISSCTDFTALRRQCIELSLQGKHLNIIGFNPWLNFDTAEELGHFTRFTIFIERQVELGRCSPRMFVAKRVTLKVLCNILSFEQGDVHICSRVLCNCGCGTVVGYLAFLWQNWSEWRTIWQMSYVHGAHQLFE